MADLAYKVGKLNIDVNTFKCFRIDSSTKKLEIIPAKHGYIVEFKGNELKIYVSNNFLGMSSHKNIAEEYGIEENDIVGGGSIYINPENKLILDDLCEQYGTVPTETARRLAKALLFDLNTMGFDVDVESIKADPPQFCLNKRCPKQ